MLSADRENFREATRYSNKIREKSSMSWNYNSVMQLADKKAVMSEGLVLTCFVI